MASNDTGRNLPEEEICLKMVRNEVTIRVLRSLLTMKRRTNRAQPKPARFDLVRVDTLAKRMLA